MKGGLLLNNPQKNTNKMQVPKSDFYPERVSVS